MSNEKDNLKIWSLVETSDPEHIKGPTTGTNGLSSIGAYYMFKQATKYLGPVGSGWGFEEVSEDYRAGAPILDTAGEIVGSVINHIVRINFWYMLNGVKCEFPSIGTTKYIQKTKYGISADEEAPKKSLTDAIKKALSMLGFSADVYMGKFDNQDYVAGVSANKAIEEADQREDEQRKKHGEIKVYVDDQIAAIKLLTNPIQANKAIDRVISKVQVRCQAAGFSSKGFETILNNEKVQENEK